MMKRFKNISLVYECEQATFDRAAQLARSNEGQLTIVQVLKELPNSWHATNVGDQCVDLKKLIVDDQQLRLDRLANSLHPLGLFPTTRLLVGEPYIEIIRDVIENRRDLVILEGNKKLGWKEYFFGSTLSALMRYCPCPVLATKSTENKFIKKVLVAVDPVLVGDSHDTLNRIILELASSLATDESAELHVVHAWSFLGETLIRGRLNIPAADIDRMVTQELTHRGRLVEELLVKNSVRSGRLHLLKGDAVEVIPELVRELKIDLLVMGTVCRTGIPGFVIGNTAEKVLGSVECSTLTVKPEGFVSPITPVNKGC